MDEGDPRSAVDLQAVAEFHMAQVSTLQSRLNGVRWTMENNRGLAAGAARRRISSIERDIAWHTAAAVCLVDAIGDRAAPQKAEA